MERESTARPRQTAARPGSREGRGERPPHDGARPGSGRRPAPAPVPQRPSRRTFVVRWVVVLLLLAAVIVGGILGVRALFAWVGGLFEKDPDAVVEAEPTPEPTGAYVPVDCTTADVQLTLASDATAYRLGGTAAFQVSIVHVGENPCTIDAGLVSREVLVTSGADRIWSSADCDTAGSRMLLLAPGNQDVETVAWSAQRSAPGCPADLPAPGAGTYQAVVNAPGLASAPVVFTLGTP